MHIISEKKLLETIEEKIFINTEEKLKKICLIFNEENFEKLTEKLNTDMESVYYSKYFWFQQFKNEYKKYYKWTADFEQYEFKILENMDNYCKINFEIIEKIEQGIIKENENFDV